MGKPPGTGRRRRPVQGASVPEVGQPATPRAPAAYLPFPPRPGLVYNASRRTGDGRLAGRSVMPRSVACLALLVCSSPLFAAGNPAAPAPAVSAKQPDVQNYPQQLLSVVGHVVTNYARPVSQADLLSAALSGLYEEA